MGYDVRGSDLDQRMVDYSDFNIKTWVQSNYKIDVSNVKIQQGDATDASWDKPIDFVASETYLGRPFTSPPGPKYLTKLLPTAI